jgi:hypothetical protein
LEKDGLEGVFDGLLDDFFRTDVSMVAKDARSFILLRMMFLMGVRFCFTYLSIGRGEKWKWADMRKMIAVEEEKIRRFRG